MTTGRMVPKALNGAEPLAPSPVSDWRAGDVYTLPSGLRARCKRAGVMAMLACGLIPNPLAAKVTKLMTLATDDEIKQRTPEQREQALLNNSEAFVAIARLTLIEPKLVLDREPEYERGEIGPADIADRDLLWIYYDFTEGTAADVVSFRAVGRPA